MRYVSRKVRNSTRQNEVKLGAMPKQKTMPKQKKPLEILAPAKDKATAFAAITFGADAIYIGANAFGARVGASNKLDDIKEICDFAHKFFAKVYVTMNTILNNDELKAAKDLVFSLYDIGVDAIIVQDFALLNMDLPKIRLFASTQCDIGDIEKVKFFEDVGFSRVILARELSLSQIENICKNSKIDIEAFVHGALCVSYSGQCYLSAALGKRSANRGNCAQPCRKTYSLLDENGKTIVKNKHLLCLKDFCALNHLQTLAALGVTSFKIEGRLKDENYVKNVVAAYNLALLGYKRSSCGKVFYDFTPNVEKTFNRGFCDYFLSGNKKPEIFNFNTSKSMGEALGKVVNVSKNYFDIKTNKEISPQDGLLIVQNEGIAGTLVNRAEKIGANWRVWTHKTLNIKKDDMVWRNFDVKFDKILKNSKTRRQIAISLKINENGLLAVDENNIRTKIEFFETEPAHDNKKMKETFINCFKKTNDADFYLSNIEFETENLPFLPISKLNALRRELFEKQTAARLLAYKKIQEQRKIKEIRPVKFPLKNNDYRLNVFNDEAFEFYKKCQVDCLEPAFEQKKPKNAELMRTKHCIRRALGLCLKEENKKLYKKLYLLSEDNKKLSLEFDCKNCEMVIKADMP